MQVYTWHYVVASEAEKDRSRHGPLQGHVHIAFVYSSQLRCEHIWGYMQAKAWFPLDRNAIVKLHDENRLWLTANVLVKI